MEKECEHNYTFLRQRSEEKSWHTWVKYDVYFCSKCLIYKEVELPRIQSRRW